MCDTCKQSFAQRAGAIAGQTAWNFGKSAGRKLLRRWTGFGDYKIAANSLIEGSAMGDSIPSISSSGRETRIVYREYIGELTTGAIAGQFNAVTYEVNPGNCVTFPWLSTIALQYDQYRPNGIIFEFRSTATDATLTASLGSVLIATEYDVSDPDYTSKQTMMNCAYSSESKTSSTQLHGIECDPTELQHNVYYTRAMGVVVNDKNDYDICKTTFATQGGGLAANQSVGSLYVHYDFTFFKEQLSNGILNKNLLFTRYATVKSGFQSASMNLGLCMQPDSIIAGTDLGITADNDTFKFPRKLQGMTFLIDFQYTTNTTPWFVTNHTYGATVGCNLLPISLQLAPLQAMDDWIVSFGNGVVPESVHMYGLMKLNDVIEVPFATYEFTNFGLFNHIAAAVSNNTVDICVTQVPSNYFSGLTTG